MDANLEMLKADFNHQDEESLIKGLEMFFDIYANVDNWRASNGSPPHFLRDLMKLDFHPSNVVDGYCFAQEALQKIKKFRRENEAQDEISAVAELEAAKKLKQYNPNNWDADWNATAVAEACGVTDKEVVDVLLSDLVSPQVENLSLVDNPVQDECLLQDDSTAQFDSQKVFDAYVPQTDAEREAAKKAIPVKAVCRDCGSTNITDRAGRTFMFRYVCNDCTSTNTNPQEANSSPFSAEGYHEYAGPTANTLLDLEKPKPENPIEVAAAASQVLKDNATTHKIKQNNAEMLVSFTSATKTMSDIIKTMSENFVAIMQGVKPKEKSLQPNESDESDQDARISLTAEDTQYNSPPDDDVSMECMNCGCDEFSIYGDGTGVWKTKCVDCGCDDFKYPLKEGSAIPVDTETIKDLHGNNIFPFLTGNNETGEIGVTDEELGGAFSAKADGTIVRYLGLSDLQIVKLCEILGLGPDVLLCKHKDRVDAITEQLDLKLKRTIDLREGFEEEMTEEEHRKHEEDPYHPEQVSMAGGSALSSKGHPLHLIPTVALQRLADRFALGVERKGDKSWNALSSNQQCLLDKDFIIERLSHVIQHALNLRDKIVADDVSGAIQSDDDAGAIAWGGMFLLCAMDKRTQPIPAGSNA